MRHQPSDFVDPDDIARAKARSPHARQNCRGSLLQVQEVDLAGQGGGVPVECPVCLKHFTSYDTQKDRAAIRPILPSHLPDHAGVMKAEMRRKKQTTADGSPRPY